MPVSKVQQETSPDRQKSKASYIDNLKRKQLLKRTPESTERNDSEEQRFMRNMEFMKSLFKDISPSKLGEDIGRTVVEGKPLSLQRAVKRYKTIKQKVALQQNCLLFPEKVG